MITFYKKFLIYFHYIHSKYHNTTHTLHARHTHGGGEVRSNKRFPHGFSPHCRIVFVVVLFVIIIITCIFIAGQDII